MIRGSALVLVALGIGGLGSAAHAEPCGNVTATGMCLDSKTVVFCDHGSLTSMACADGEICDLNAAFDGAAACVGTRYAGCGDVSESGQCVGNTLLYCESSRVKERVCAAGTTCAWIADEKWFDCVGDPAARAPENDTQGADSDAGTAYADTAPRDDDASGGDTSAADDTAPTASDTASFATNAADSGPSTEDEAVNTTPTVQKGGAKSASDYVATGSGCGAGAASLDVGLALGLLALVGRAGQRGRRARLSR